MTHRGASFTTAQISEFLQVGTHFELGHTADGLARVPGTPPSVQLSHALAGDWPLAPRRGV